MTGDQTVFNDDDGKAYLICSSASGRGNLYVAPLRAADYLKVEQATRIFGGVGREGNCMFKYRGRYYFCSSDLHGWNASHCYYISSANIMGPYSSEKIMTTTDFDFCHVTQTGFFITVSGSKDTTVLFCGDRWCDFAGNGIGYNQWCPLSFNGIDAVFNSVTQFNLDAAAGSWSTGAGNNYILNPGFEADRITQTELAGWTNSKGATSIGNASGAHSGNFCIQLTSASAYADTVYQDIKQIPNGTYTLKAWVKSSGGQTACKVFISDFGSAEMSSDISKSMNAWTQISITGIKITNGKCRVGIASDAKADNNCRADDFLLVNASPDAVVAGTALVLALPSENGFIKAVSGRPFTLPLVNGHSAMRLFVYDLSGKRIGMVATRSRVIDLEKECRTAPGTYLVKIAKSAVTCSQANKPLLLRCSESREFDAP
jgi:hypothetical protein